MTEQLIHSLLLALHNVALAGCAAAAFYNLSLVERRASPLRAGLPISPTGS